MQLILVGKKYHPERRKGTDRLTKDMEELRDALNHSVF